VKSSTETEILKVNEVSREDQQPWAPAEIFLGWWAKSTFYCH